MSSIRHNQVLESQCGRLARAFLALCVSGAAFNLAGAHLITHTRCCSAAATQPKNAPWLVTSLPCSYPTPKTESSDKLHRRSPLSTRKYTCHTVERHVAHHQLPAAHGRLPGPPGVGVPRLLQPGEQLVAHMESNIEGEAVVCAPTSTACCVRVCCVCAPFAERRQSPPPTPGAAAVCCFGLSQQPVKASPSPQHHVNPISKYQQR